MLFCWAFCFIRPACLMLDAFAFSGLARRHFVLRSRIHARKDSSESNLARFVEYHLAVLGFILKKVDTRKMPFNTRFRV